MRLALTKYQHRHADIFCDEARKAKQHLQRHSITQVTIDYYLNGRESGHQFICWAIRKCLMPQHVLLTEANIERRKAMGFLLERNGYRSADDMNFMKYH
jgi:hypothetical protein